MAEDDTKDLTTEKKREGQAQPISDIAGEAEASKDAITTKGVQPMTREDIQAVIDMIPTLNAHGVGAFDAVKREYRAAYIASEQETLLRSAEECTKICEWLAQIEKTETPRPHAGSYFLKHLAEEEIGYVTNGAFIAAAVHCGFDFEIEPNSPNPYFNMSKKSIQQTKGYKKRYNT
jgi:hypothetical protein